MTFIKFLILISLGMALMVYREKVQSFTGSVGFAEKYFGPGGTFNFYLLLGAGMIVFAVLYGTGTLDTFIQSTASRFFIVPHR